MTLTAAPQIGLGTVVSIGTLGASPTFTAIAKLKKVTPPQPKWGTEDTTTLDTTGNTRTFIKSLIDPGEFTLDGEYASADPGQIALSAAFLAPSNQANGAAYPFKVVLPVNLAGGQTTIGDTFTFSGLVTDFAVQDEDIDKIVMFKATIKISGAGTYAEGA